MYSDFRLEEFRTTNRMTAAKAREMLGWTEDEEEARKAGFLEPLLTIKEGETLRKIWCLRNIRNRPFNKRRALSLSQDILNLRWQFNGETIVIGRTGRVLSGQHRLVALVLAHISWSNQYSFQWHQNWPEEPSIEVVVAFGVSEDPEVVRTLDNVKPRSFADVLFTQDDSFADIKAKDQKTVCKMTEWAIRMLWQRTGANDNAFRYDLTNSEASDFLSRHPTVKDCVLHILDCNRDRVISENFVSPGYASALLYLMGSSTTQSDDYDYRDQECNEVPLDWSLMDRAKQFWTDLARAEPHMQGIRDAFAEFYGEGGSGKGGTKAERFGTLAKAWSLYAQGQKFKLEDLRLEREPDDKGRMHLTETTTFGGIDRGDPKDTKVVVAEDPGTEPEDTDDEDEEVVLQVEDRKKQVLIRNGVISDDDESPEAERKRREEVTSRYQEEQERKKQEAFDRKKAKEDIKLKSPPTPKSTPKPKAPKPGSRRAIEAEQTRKAMEADEKMKGGK
jgi:hypothetical protein